MRKINFLAKYQEQLKQKTRRLFFLQVSAFSILIVYGLVMVATFAYHFILSKENQSLDNNINLQKKRIEEASVAETKQTYLKAKTVNLKQILSEAQSHQIVIEGFFNLIPEEIDIKGFVISQNEVVTFQGRTATFAPLAKLISNIQKRQFGQRQIFAVSLDNFSLNNEGDYSFSFTLYLQPPKNQEPENT